MDALDAFLRLHHAAGQAAWLRDALRPGEAPDADVPRRPIEAAALLQAPVSLWRSLGAPEGARDAAFGPDADARVRRVRDWLAADARHAVLGWADDDYPSLLREAPRPPTALFVDGQADRLWWPQIAVVGSRAPTPAGRERAAQWARAFAEAGFVVTSGLATGVDAAAHGAAIEAAAGAAGPGTLAVTGTGPDRCFPASHRSLHAAVARAGAVVTEHAPGTDARAEHFPSRNRIIAGLSLATVVVEAAHRSGALITARLAADSGREVFAIPGAPENLKARGCHRLIRDGAVLVDEPQQVLDALVDAASGITQRLRNALRADLPATPPRQAGMVWPAPAAADAESAATRALLESEGRGLGFDELLARSGLTPATLAPILLAMELEGRLTQQHGVYLPCRSAPPTRAGLQRRR